MITVMMILAGFLGTLATDNPVVFWAAVLGALAINAL